MSTTWGVDSYHIAVGGGDAAIHLLIKNFDQANAAIESAVLIDGGNGGVGIVNNLRWTMNSIATKYSKTLKKQPLKFDTIVITHWDHDHYQGIIDLIDHDIATQQHQDVKNYQISFMKYATTGRTAPLTHLYAPYFGTVPERTGVNFNDPPPSFTEGQGESLTFTTKDGKVYPQICNLVHNDFRGINLFENTRLPAGVYTSHLTSPKQLYYLNPPHTSDKTNKDVTRPGIYCVGTNELHLYPNKDKKKKKKKAGLSVNISGGLGVVDEKGTTGTNLASIFTMVIWSDGHLSHYSAGDADWNMERSVAHWSMTTGNPKVPGGAITSMKLSHHGAKKSTPISALKHYIPANVIVSCGTSYGHPCWEVLLYLEALYLAKQVHTNPKFIYSTSYPHWLSKTQPGEVYDDVHYVSPKGLHKTGKKGKWAAYKSGVMTLYKDIDKKPKAANLASGSQIPCIFDEWDKLQNKPDAEDAKQWICRRMETRWGRCSHTTAAQMPASGAAWMNGNMIPNNLGRYLRYIKVKSRGFDHKDEGMVTLQYHDEADEVLPVAPVQMNGVQLATANKRFSQNEMKSSKQFPIKKKIKNEFAFSYLGSNCLGNSLNCENDFNEMDSDTDQSYSDSASENDSSDRAEIKLEGDINATNPTASTNTTASVGDDDDTTYYMYGTDFAGASRSQTASTFAVNTDLDDFVNLLHRCVIGLASAPPSVGNSTTPFGDYDEWYCWLKDSIQATQLTASATAGTIDTFTITMASPLDTIAQPAPATPNPQLTFCTQHAESALDLEPLKIGKMGFPPDVGIMVFGLDKSSFPSTTPPTMLDMTLQQVFDYCGLSNMAGSFVMTFLGIINLQLNVANSEKKRNAVWFDPVTNYRTVVRLQFDMPSTDLATFNGLFQDVLPGLDLDGVTVIAKRTSFWALSRNGPLVQTEGDVTLIAQWTYEQIVFDISIEFREKQMKIEIKVEEPGNALEAIVKWLEGACQNLDLGFVSEWLGNAADESSVPNLRRITLTIGISNTGAPTLTNFTMDVEVVLCFGITPNEKVVFLVSLNWVAEKHMDGVELKGTLWCASPPQPTTLKIFPDYEPHLQFAPITSGTLSQGLNLESLFGGSSVITGPTSGFPTNVVQAYVTLTNSKISFGGKLGDQPPTQVPALSLSILKLDASYEWKTKNTTLSFDVGILLKPSENTTAGYDVPASLWGKLSYEKGTWTVAASIQNLYASALYTFLDADAQSGGVMSFLERIEIQYLNLMYTYHSGGKDNFDFTGNILIGNLQLTLTYHYPTSGDWTFSAKLDPTVSGTSTVGEIVDSIVGGTASNMPSFVANIPVSDKDSIEFLCKKPEKKSTTNTSMLYSGSITIGDFQLFYAQYRDGVWPATASPKRIIKATVSGLGTCNFPVVGELQQPFDEMYYLWVEDTSNQNGTIGAGLLQKEVEAINTQLSPNDKLLVKALSSVKPLKTDLVIPTGSHFVVVMDEKGTKTAVIDYVFGQPKPTTESTDIAVAGRARALQGGGGGEDTGGDSGPSMAAYKKTIGPLSITNIGFQLKGTTLSVLFDATFALGPLSLTLIGFGLGLDFSGASVNLQSLPPVVPSLSGLAVSFNRPPLVISGLFEHNSSVAGDIYVGGVIVAFDPYLFEAAGFYGNLVLGGKNEITACVFGMLNGPLVELEFAEISGITGGFGYNSALRFPSVSEVESFPFINMPVPAPTDPMGALLDMMGNPPTGWFTPLDSSYWVAAGLKVTAFETLMIDAVVVVEWNPSVCLGIFGVAAADIPADPDIKEKFARVELGIAATVDFAAGLMKFEAQLMPSSFVLSPDCHLTGGFALYYWFEGSDPAMQGDWVFTIGGYNQAFKAPSQYPNPPRLAISWSLDQSLSITGQAYFAMTPKVCMGGGLLHASLSLGPLQAFFDAYADFLINYKPFHFIADAGISVGVRYTMDLWLVTLHISVDIGAHIYLQGPPMSGKVHVDFWVFGFDINFGPGADPVVAVSLEDFYNLVYQASIQPSVAVASNSSAPATIATVMGTDTTVVESGKKRVGGGKKATVQKDHIFSCQSGQVSSTDGTSIPAVTDAWLVRAAAFSFGIACRMAIDTVEITDDPSATVPQPPNKIYSKPMQLTEALSSDLIVTIESSPAPPAGSPNVWRVAPTLKAVPSALWGIYDPNQDPSNPGADNLGNLLQGGSAAITLMMGVTISAPFPTASKDLIPPFNAALESSETITPGGTFPAVVEESPDWLPIPGTGGDDQWDLVETKWQNPLSGQASAQTMVMDWGTLFGWDTNPLVGDAPTTLLGAFGVLYMDAPLLGVASTTEKSAEVIAV